MTASESAPEPYPGAADLADLAELGDLIKSAPIRMRLVVEPDSGLDQRDLIRLSRLSCTAVEVAGCWVELSGTGWDGAALAEPARPDARPEGTALATTYTRTAAR